MPFGIGNSPVYYCNQYVAWFGLSKYHQCVGYVVYSFHLPVDFGKWALAAPHIACLWPHNEHTVVAGYWGFIMATKLVVPIVVMTFTAHRLTVVMDNDGLGITRSRNSHHSRQSNHRLHRSRPRRLSVQSTRPASGRNRQFGPQ